MENCHNTGDITYNTAAVGECYFGGLVGCDGENASSTMINCYNEGSISTNSGVYAGGLLGRNNWMDIRNCYAICFIDAQTSAGLVGDGLRMRAITQITNCYYYGTMDATNTNYGIAGQSNIYNTNYRMELDHCYYPNDINSICGLVTYAASSCATMSSATDASTLSALNNNIPSGGKSWVIRDGHIVFQ